MYEILDFIADAYTPILFICFFVACSAAISSKKYWLTMKGFVFLVMALLFSYGVMFADHHFMWFARASLDYSTHTAVALSGVMAIAFMGWSKAWLGASLLGYGLLMLYQRYHTVLDIAVTVLVIAPFLSGVFYFLRRQCDSR
jgi:hypothetical protein